MDHHWNDLRAQLLRTIAMHKQSAQLVRFTHPNIYDIFSALLWRKASKKGSMGWHGEVARMLSPELPCFSQTTKNKQQQVTTACKDLQGAFRRMLSGPFTTTVFPFLSVVNAH